jgi:hypothetical protein
MKAKKLMSYTQLMTKVSNVFPLKSTPLIKQLIESLIEREYLRRVEENLSVLEYID